MVHLPITCPSCGKSRYNYGDCNCPDGRLLGIDRRRAALNKALMLLDDEEREVLGLKQEAG